MGTRVLYMAILIGSTALADDVADRAKLAGAWLADEGTSWVLQNTADTVKITQSQNGQRVSEIECNVTGKECEVNESGHKAKVSFWFNGPKLVEFETKGSEVVKRTFVVSGQQDVIDVEIIPIVPGGKAEKSQFHRAPVSSAQR